jgi:hypothetical protein
MARRFALLFAQLALAGARTLAATDPTAPPPGLAAEAGARPAVRAASAGARAASAATALALRVESVRIGGGQRASALVDGRLVQVGDRIGTAVVKDITGQGLTLRAADGSARRLALAPGVQMRVLAEPESEPDRERDRGSAVAAVPVKDLR